MKLIFILFSIIFFISCYFNKEQGINWENYTRDSGICNLFFQAYKHQNDSKFSGFCNDLNDSMRILDNDLWLYSQGYTLEYKGEIKKIDWYFEKRSKSDFPLYSKSLFDVLVKNRDTILIESEAKNISDIAPLGYDYLFSPKSKYPFQDKIINKHEGFAEISVSPLQAKLSVELNPKVGLSSEEWILFFKCLHELVVLYDNRINEIAREKWNKNYESISFEQKDSLLNIFNHKIILFLNLENK